LVPGAMGVLWMLGGLVSKLGYTDDAVKVFEEIAERSKAAGDEGGAIAALQQILLVDPANSKALAQVRKYAGYGRALVTRYATAITSVVVLLVTVAVGGYETLALQAYKTMRDEK